MRTDLPEGSLNNGHPLPTALWPRWIYLRILAVGFLTGFLSLSTQIHGLVGPHGILPAQEYLTAIAAQQPVGWRFLLAPSLLWCHAGSPALDILCWSGVIASVLLLINRWPRGALFVCWLSYLSYASVARDFSAFQSDGLMLESALLAIFLAPRGLRPGLGEDSPSSRVAIWMLRWLLFRLLFESGGAKILSGDLSWRGFTALDDYYENCPFPTWIGWTIQHLPHGFHAFTVGLTFFVELLCPPMIFLGRRFRILAFFFIVLFQGGILLTANYTFLNANTIALAFLLLDDALLRRNVPSKGLPQLTRRWRRWGAGVFLTIHGYLTTIWMMGALGAPLGRLPPWTLVPLELTQHFRSANAYGLFAVMTHERHEIEFEGSNDGGETWRTYEFKWQPQRLTVPPRFMAPHLPRLDWNLWFASLGTWQEYPFVLKTAFRLIEGEPTVLCLFAKNPFPDKPPALIRFPLYRYQFTDLRTLRITGAYWRRERIGDYAPAIFKDPADGRFKPLPQEQFLQGVRR